MDEEKDEQPEQEEGESVKSSPDDVTNSEDQAPADVPADAEDAPDPEEGTETDAEEAQAEETPGE